ncbi:MAG TPA: tryptophan--tRNA ligase [Methanocorpusculum sp.]|nr:tryptophan--tRNA ligase [Methanocorpusculum sp.]
MAEQINPWSSTPNMDVDHLIKDFGIDPISTLKDKILDPPQFISRHIVAGHRGYNTIIDAINNKTPFHVITGFMPSGSPHLGHLMVMKEVVWHTKKGGNGFISIADREAHAVRELSWDKCDKYAKEYLKCLYALGFGETETVYTQHRNNKLKDLAFEISTKINFSQLSAIYGFESSTKLAHAISVSMQVADILYPQLVKGIAPTVVPVGIDQDPHIRLTRDVTNALHMFSVEDTGDKIRIYLKKTLEGFVSTTLNDHIKLGYFTDLRKYIEKNINYKLKLPDDYITAYTNCDKIYAGHIEIPHYNIKKIESIIQEYEKEVLDGFGFTIPSSTYHGFLQGLQGGKMSSSVPDSLISFDDQEDDIKKKIMRAFTGGQSTLEDQKKLGGNPDKCSIYQLNRFHLQPDDTKLDEMYKKCKSGDLTCGTCKKECIESLNNFLLEFKEKRDSVEHIVEEKFNEINNQ